MFESEESTICWDATDIKMAIKRYFHKMDRSETEEAILEIEFLRSIHREWSYNPLMRRTDPAGMLIIDEFLKWFDATPAHNRKINDFTVRRLLK
jgi:hypothetical protein